MVTLSLLGQLGVSSCGRGQPAREPSRSPRVLQAVSPMKVLGVCRPNVGKSHHMKVVLDRELPGG